MYTTSLKRKRLIDNWDAVLIISIIGIPFALWRIASKWEDNNEADQNEIDEIDKDMKYIKKQIEQVEGENSDGHYSDEDNLKKWT